MKDLLVMKFGGTSMGSAERMQVAAKLTAEQHAKRPVAIVVSAMSKITDLLLDTLRKAEKGDEAGMQENLFALMDRHVECCVTLLPEEAQKTSFIRMQCLIDEFGQIARGVLLLRERPLQSVDRAISTGEMLSSVLVAAYLTAQGTPAEAVNAAEVIATDAVFGNATPLLDPTRERAAKVLRPLLEKTHYPRGDWLQRLDTRWPSDNTRARRLRFFGIHSRGGTRRGGIMDLDRRRRHHER